MIKKKHNTLFRTIAAVILSALAVSCTHVRTAFQSEMELLNSRGRNGEVMVTILEQKEGHNGELYGLLTSPLLPGTEVLGEIRRESPDDDSLMVFDISEVHFLSNWDNGWTDVRYESSGLIQMNTTGEPGMFQCSVLDSFTLWDIFYGEIRYYNKYYRGDDGLTKARNRVNRINEVSSLLKDSGYMKGMYGSLGMETHLGESFEDALTVYLFPEMADFEDLEEEHLLPDPFFQGEVFGAVPDGIMHADPADYQWDELYAHTVYGSGLSWRVDYTSVILPEEMWELRNSGTLWRDFEESPELFLSVYNIGELFQLLAESAQFIRVVTEYEEVGGKS